MIFLFINTSQVMSHLIMTVTSRLLHGWGSHPREWDGSRPVQQGPRVVGTILEFCLPQLINPQYRAVRPRAVLRRKPDLFA